ncbi:MAG TPA: amidohydrolase family protein [Solirubrobacterales bacterium]|nr:amidohydrolase family protein [Solirubrobacterales bacterium]
MDTIIRQAAIRGRDGTWDVGVEGEAIGAVEQSIDGSADREIDGQGCLLSPGFVNAHVHLDKCMLGEVMRPNQSQTLQEAIEITWDHKRSYTVEEIADRASPVVDLGILNGTTAVRAFADVDTIGGMTPVEGLLELKRRFEGETTFEVVAFPQEGIIRNSGCAELMKECMALGADVVGGLPWYERTDRHMWDHIDFCFELAKETGKDIHMLVDDTDDPNSRSLEYLALRTLEEGYGGRVTASHCGALGAYDHTYAEKVIGMVREAGMTIASNTQISLVMSGHSDRGLVRRGITRVRELLDAGVNVIAAQDDVNDPYYPLGRSDQLEVGQYTAHVAQLTYPSDLETVFDMITGNAAKAMQLDGYGLDAGDRADLVLIEARSAHEALRLLPSRRAVLYGGRLVAETRSETARHRVGSWL